jgi:hypothetical protein
MQSATTLPTASFARTACTRTTNGSSKSENGVTQRNRPAEGHGSIHSGKECASGTVRSTKTCGVRVIFPRKPAWMNKRGQEATAIFQRDWVAIV